MSRGRLGSTWELANGSQSTSVTDADLTRQIEQLKRCEVIPEPVVKDLCQKAKEILIEEGNVQYVDSPVTVSSPRHMRLACS